VFRGFDQLFREFERELPAHELRLGARGDHGRGPSAFVLKVEVPGIPEKDVHVELHDGVLTVSAERTTEAPQGYALRRRERSALRFSRSYALGDHVDAEKTTAELKDGVLTVGLGKSSKVQKKSIP